MRLGQQSVSSEAAAVLVSCCVLLPPLGTTPEDKDMRRELLPYVDHVRNFQSSTDERIKNTRLARMRPWSVFGGGFHRERAVIYAKFSLIYFEQGRWEDAKRLQIAVKDFTT